MATKKRKKKKKRYAATFYPIYPARIGTPREQSKGSYGGATPPPSTPPPSDGSSGGSSGPMLGGGGTGGSAGGGAAGGGMTASRLVPSRHLVLHELRRAMGFTTEGFGSATDSNWAGYQTAAPLMIKQRTGGPTIGGPGFQYDPADHPNGGVTDPGTSPGIGLRSEYGWRIWKAALDVMRGDKTLPKTAIFMAAVNRAGIPMISIDPSESRLIEMGIEWYLSQSQGDPMVRDGTGGTPTRGAP